MSDDFRNVKGMKELGKVLDELPEKLARNIMRSGLRAGAVVVREYAQANVNVRTGKLRKGIKVRTNYKNGIATATVYVTGEHAFIAPWLEFGTSAHRILPKKGKMLSFAGVFSRGVENPGMRPHPFMRPAMDTQAGPAVVAVGEQIKKRLTKEGIDTPDVDVEEV